MDKTNAIYQEVYNSQTQGSGDFDKQGEMCIRDRQVFLREHPRKEGEGMTLESVVTRLGLPMERQFHDALSDTLYTACLLYTSRCV